MSDPKRFCYEHKRELLSFGMLFALTVLLCIPFTLGYAVKVFGWAVWFYLAVGYAAAILNCLKKQVNLNLRSVIFLALAVFFAIATLHVAFLGKGATDSFTDYIVESYQRGSAGGAVVGIITSPIAVLCTFVWSIVIFMVATAAFLFLFLRPFIFEGSVSPIVSKKAKPAVPAEKPEFHEIILDDSPFMNKNKKTERAPIPFMVEPEKEEDPREILFGGEKETYSPSDNAYRGGKSEYDVTRYPIKNFVTTEEEVSDEKASELLFGDDEKVEFDDDNILNYDEPETTETLFDDEKDETIPDLLSSDPISTFKQSLVSQPTERYAPAPMRYEKTTEPVFDEDEEEDEDDIPSVDVSEEEPEEENEPAPAPVTEGTLPPDAKISQEYVFYNGAFVKVVNSLPVTPAPAFTPTPAPVNEPEPEEPQPASGRKIVQLVKRPDLPYNKPPTSILKNHVTENFTPTVDNWEELKEIFESRLKNFGIEAKLVDAIKGPTVTLCALELGDRCPISKLYSLKTDLQRWLKSSKPIAIIPQITGTDYCGVQIPNEIKGTVGFKEILTSREYREAKGDLVIAMGKTAEGEVLIEDLAAMPHALVAGETGSGKSVCLNVILSSLIFRYSPDEVKLILIDLKEVEMAPYAGLPHMLLRNPLSGIPEIVNALKWVRDEVQSRFNLFKSMHIRNLNEYNSREGVEKLSRIVVIIDEASELMTDPNARKTVESTLSSLARIARAAGIHLIFATQNPVKAVITNEIQNNLNTKIAFAVGDYNHSMVIFKAKGAECLLGRGDMYIKKGQDMKRAQCAFVSTEEIEEAVQYIQENNEYDFNDEEIEKILNGTATQPDQPAQPSGPSPSSRPSAPSSAPAQEEDDDSNAPDLMWQALKICVETNYVSCSYLQRKLKRGYNTIANVVEQLAAEGYISAVPQGSKEKRDILISKEEFYRRWEERFGPAEDGDFDDGEN